VSTGALVAGGIASFSPADRASATRISGTGLHIWL